MDVLQTVLINRKNRSLEDAMKPLKYDVIHEYEQLIKYYQNNEPPIRPIEFVSILSGIKYVPNDRCTFYFDNFSSGIKDRHTYNATLNIESLDSGIMFEILFTLLSEKLELDLECIDFSSPFELKELENERISIFHVKGLIHTDHEIGSLKLHKLCCLDLEKFFNDPTSTEINEHKTKIDKILKNMLKMETKYPHFKLTLLKNFSDSMRKYMYENRLSRNIINPLFHQALLTRVQEDSLNDFNSQTQSQTQTQQGYNTHTFPSASISPQFEKESEFDDGRKINKSVESFSSISDIQGHNTSENLNKNLIFKNVDQSRTNHASEEDSHITKSKKIKLTDIGLVKTKRSCKNSRKIELETDTKPSSIVINDPRCTTSLQIGQTTYLNDVRILGYDNYNFGLSKATSTDVALVLYVYCYNLPLFGSCFFPETNCFEISVIDVDALFFSLSIPKEDSENEKQKKLSEITSSYKCDIVVEKQKKKLGSVFSVHLVFKTLFLKKRLSNQKNNSIAKPANAIPIITVDQITASEDPHFYTIFGLGVTTKYSGGKSMVLSFTDFTTNSLNNYGFDSFIGSFSQRLPPTKHVHAVIYLNRVETVNEKLRAIIKMNLHDCADKGNSNITHRGLIFKFTVKCQLFNGKLNTVIFDADPITPETPLSSVEQSFVSRVRSSTIDHMSMEAMELYMLTLARFLPIEKDPITGKFKLSEKYQNSTSPNSSSHFDDPIKQIENQVHLIGDSELERLDANKPDNPTATRITSILDIPRLKALQTQAFHNNCILNLKLVHFEYSPQRIIFYGIDPNNSKTLIEDPYNELIVLQLCGIEKLKLFFNHKNFEKHDYDLTKCIDSCLQIVLTPRRQKISRYLCINIWQPVYLTYESMVLHKTMEIERNEWKSEELSEIL